MRRRPNGAGTIQPEGAGYSLRIESKKYGDIFESGFRTRGEAENRAAILRSERLHRRLGVAADHRLTPTLDELAAPWLERRRVTNSSGAEDAGRWRNHIAPTLGHLRPDEVDAAAIRSLVESKLGELAPGTIRICVAILSSLYEDLLERHLAQRNPARHLPKSILRLMRSDHDPETVPFLERLEDVRRVYLRLADEDEGIAVAFAIGALAGLRTGEVFALRWTSVDLAGRRIVVSEGGKRGTKDRDARVVPILDPLQAVLEPWRLAHPGPGPVVPPMRCDGERIDKGTPGPILRAALTACGLDRLAAYPKAWYAATRHSFASQWVMAGRSMRELQKILGHSSLTITERYAHLAPDYFAPGVHSALPVSLARGTAEVRALPTARETPGTASTVRVRSRKR
jgi:integrase